MRILVTGSRDWDDKWAIECALAEYLRPLGQWDDEFHFPAGTVRIVHGGCTTGADSLVDQWACDTFTPVEVFEADWPLYGKVAGIIRNRAMVHSKPDVCLAFIKNKSKGATHCADYAERQGIPTVRYVR